METTNDCRLVRNVWIVMENCRTKHSDETTEVIAVKSSEKSAQAVVAECKKQISEDWKGMLQDGIVDETWEVQDDNSNRYTLARSIDYEYFYSVWIERKKVED